MLIRPLILASASPRRAELLTQVGVPFTVIPSHAAEPPPSPGEDVFTWCSRMAEAKAHATARNVPVDTPALILGADTVVVIDGGETMAPRLHDCPVEVLGKPRNPGEANCMLQRLSGQTHIVVSAFTLLAHPEGLVYSDMSETRVTFYPLTPVDITYYVATGEPLDKAGAYGIQERGAVLVERIDGDYYTVVGLPLARLWRALVPWRK
jgi:septum formation protein